MSSGWLVPNVQFQMSSGWLWFHMSELEIWMQDFVHPSSRWIDNIPVSSRQRPVEVTSETWGQRLMILQMPLPCEAIDDTKMITFNFGGWHNFYILGYIFKLMKRKHLGCCICCKAVQAALCLRKTSAWQMIVKTSFHCWLFFRMNSVTKRIHAVHLLINSLQLQRPVC